MPAPSPSERVFRDSFERLKAGAPLSIDPSCVVTQNNVAREAGRHPSDLKKSRYPILVAEIQAWITTHQRPRSAAPPGDSPRSDDLKAAALAMKEQRDLMGSMLCEADTRVLELLEENDELSKIIAALRGRLGIA